MAKLDLFKLTVPAYYNLVRIFIKILGGDKNVPKRYTIGGSRKGGKTRCIFIFFGILYALAHPNSFIVIVTEKSGAKEDVWKTMNNFIDKVAKVRAKVRSSKQSPHMEFQFLNGSAIYVRSLRQADSNTIALKGLPRPTDLKDAILIEDECNTWPEKWFGIVREAIVAENIIDFRLFNTDHIKQPIVAYLQEHLPENVDTMKTIGNMIDIHEVNGVLEYFQRTNTLVTWHVLPEAVKQQIIADDKANPTRGRVARWGLNGRDGKLLYTSLAKRHFINSDELPDKYSRFKRLPYQLFKYYRIGIDEGHSSDKMVISMKGKTYSGRLVWLEGHSWTPPKNGDLEIASVSLQMVTLIKTWASMYPNMKYQGVRIRTEWAGNGIAVKQTIERELDKTNITYTSDNAKKSTGAKADKGVKPNKSTQPQLEARAAMKNYLLGYNQLLWWNAPTELQDEYEARGRDEEGLIIDGDDHWGDAEDYLEIPEHKDMIENQPKMTFAEELDECIQENNL